MNNRFLSLLTLLLGLGAAACNSKTTAPGVEIETRQEASRPFPLRGTKWVLMRVEDQAVPLDTANPVYVQILTGQYRAEGQAGCNRFSGDIVQARPDRLRFGPLLSTKMACDRLALETSFTKALLLARRYAISADTLRLYDSLAQAHKPLAVLRAAR